MTNNFKILLFVVIISLCKVNHVNGLLGPNAFGVKAMMSKNERDYNIHFSARGVEKNAVGLDFASSLSVTPTCVGVTGHFYKEAQVDNFATVDEAKNWVSF